MIPSLDHNPSVLRPVADARMIRSQVRAELAGEDARVEMCIIDDRKTLMHPHVHSLNGQRSGVQGTVVQRGMVESIPAPTSRTPTAHLSLRLPPNRELPRGDLSQTASLGQSILPSAEHEESSFIRASASKEVASPPSRTPSRQSGPTCDLREIPYQAIKLHNKRLPRLLSAGTHSVHPHLSVLLDILGVRMRVSAL